MSRIWFPNFDVEYQWREQANFRLSKSIFQLQQDMACVFLVLAQQGDGILTESPWTESWLEQMAEMGFAQVERLSVDSVHLDEERALQPWGSVHPLNGERLPTATRQASVELEAVRRVNSKIRNLEYEQQAGIAVVGSAIVECEEQLLQQLRAYPEIVEWLLKAEFAAASRDRWKLTTTQGEFTQYVPNSQPFKRDNTLVLEPFLKRVEETSWHWEVLQSGETNLLGVTGLLTEKGRFLGNRVVSQAIQQEWIEQNTWLVQTQKDYLNQQAKNGYWGPVSIDAMTYQASPAEFRQRPLQDVNGRYSMGRVSWELGQRLLQNAGELECRYVAFPTAEQLQKAEQQSTTRLIAPERADGKPPQFAVMVTETG